MRLLDVDVAMFGIVDTKPKPCYWRIFSARCHSRQQQARTKNSSRRNRQLWVRWQEIISMKCMLVIEVVM
eukprot:scaffold49_cov82-Skeletonema_dohrnii-CCMP3373.AAC.4